jgi:hypothetical protein
MYTQKGLDIKTIRAYTLIGTKGLGCGNNEYKELNKRA